MGYISGKVVRELREKSRLTQRELAERIHVSHKTISKWETEKGFPDIGILPELAKQLGVSVAELLTGEIRENENRSGNLRKTHLYVCPICSNVIAAVGKGSFSCCGILLPEAEPEEPDEEHEIMLEKVEDELCVTMEHPMHKQHYISFLAVVTADRAEIIKLYPEQDICVRIRKRKGALLYAYCSRHGLFRTTIK